MYVWEVYPEGLGCSKLEKMITFSNLCNTAVCWCWNKDSHISDIVIDVSFKAMGCSMSMLHRFVFLSLVSYYALHLRFWKVIIWTTYCLCWTLRNNQFGFITGHSCFWHLLTTLSIIYNNSTSHIQVDIIFLDLKKGFNSILHDEVLVKLKYWNNSSLW